VGSEWESGVEGELVASRPGGDADDGGGQPAVAGVAQVDCGGPDRERGIAVSGRGGESGGVSGQENVAGVVDVSVDDVLVADEVGDGRVGRACHEVRRGRDLA
jgi:hypothetical protein